MTESYRTQFMGYIPPPLPGTNTVAKPDAYTPYAAGPKQYGAGGRTNPTSGPVSPEGLEGYQDRDRKASVARDAMLRTMQAQQSGNFASSAWLGGQANGTNR